MLQGAWRREMSASNCRYILAGGHRSMPCWNGSCGAAVGPYSDTGGMLAGLVGWVKHGSHSVEAFIVRTGCEPRRSTLKYWLTECTQVFSGSSEVSSSRCCFAIEPTTSSTSCWYLYRLFLVVPNYCSNVQRSQVPRTFFILILI